MFCVVFVANGLRNIMIFFTATTSRHVCTIVCVGTIITCCCFFWSQYQLVFSWIHLIYCALKTSSPADIICTSHVVSYFKVYASETNLITYYPIVDVSVVFMESYLPYWTNEDVLLLMTSRTTWWISSKSSFVVDLCDNVMIFQLLMESRTSQ